MHLQGWCIAMRAKPGVLVNNWLEGETTQLSMPVMGVKGQRPQPSPTGRHPLLGRLHRTAVMHGGCSSMSYQCTACTAARRQGC